jgi:hypothetical protein
MLGTIILLLVASLIWLSWKSDKRDGIGRRK